MSNDNKTKGRMFSDSQIDLIRRTVCEGYTKDQADLFITICENCQLDPLMKLIMPIKRWDNRLKRETMSTIVRIDGLRLIAERTGTYCPGRSPRYEYKDDGTLDHVEVFAHKRVGEKWMEISHVAFFEEYCQRAKDGRPSGLWGTMPKSQTAKCAEAALLRKGWPQDMGALYAREEMDQAKNHTNTAQDPYELLAALLDGHESIADAILDRCGVACISDIPESKLAVITKWVQAQISGEVDHG